MTCHHAKIEASLACMGHWAEQTVAVVSTVAGVAGAYFAYVAVRGQLRRPRGRSRTPPPPSGPEPAGPYDVFISYADADAPLAERLAARLRDEGLRVFLAQWIEVGLIEYLEKERALLGSANGVLMFSEATMNDPKIRDEYAALLQRVHSGGQRFIPVLVTDVDLPPFAGIRRPLDLRGPSLIDDDERIAMLVRAVRP
jgi:hypothetical protein